MALITEKGCLGESYTTSFAKMSLRCVQHRGRMFRKRPNDADFGKQGKHKGCVSITKEDSLDEVPQDHLEVAAAAAGLFELHSAPRLTVSQPAQKKQKKQKSVTDENKYQVRRNCFRATFKAFHAPIESCDWHHCCGCTSPPRNQAHYNRSGHPTLFSSVCTVPDGRTRGQESNNNIKRE